MDNDTKFVKTLPEPLCHGAKTLIMGEHIYPIHSQMLDLESKEELLGQRSRVFWMTGLSGAGKSTLAIQIERRLHDLGRFCKILDGDNIRSRINADLGFSMEDRKENIRRVAEIGRLFQESGAIVLCTFICPTDEARAMAKSIIGADRYREVYIDVELAEAESRDPKGLYKKARAGLIKDFTGIDSAYEIPRHPDFVVRTGGRSVQESVDDLLAYVLSETNPSAQ